MTKYNTDDQKWQALLDRDPDAEGQFVYGVTSTFIVCRPICPSRLGLKRNVVFFNTINEAISNGYRPCKRCKPDDETWNKQRQVVMDSCEIIQDTVERGGKKICLEDLSKKVGLSKWHFLRVFKNYTQLTPREYYSQLKSGDISKIISFPKIVTKKTLQLRKEKKENQRKALQETITPTSSSDRKLTEKEVCEGGCDVSPNNDSFTSENSTKQHLIKAPNLANTCLNNNNINSDAEDYQNILNEFMEFPQELMYSDLSQNQSKQNNEFANKACHPAMSPASLNIGLTLPTPTSPSSTTNNHPTMGAKEIDIFNLDDHTHPQPKKVKLNDATSVPINRNHHQPQRPEFHHKYRHSSTSVPLNVMSPFLQPHSNYFSPYLTPSYNVPESPDLLPNLKVEGFQPQLQYISPLAEPIDVEHGLSPLGFPTPLNLNDTRKKSIHNPSASINRYSQISSRLSSHGINIGSTFTSGSRVPKFPLSVGSSLHDLTSDLDLPYNQQGGLKNSSDYELSPQSVTKRPISETTYLQNDIVSQMYTKMSPTQMSFPQSQFDILPESNFNVSSEQQGSNSNTESPMTLQAKQMIKKESLKSINENEIAFTMNLNMGGENLSCNEIQNKQFPQTAGDSEEQDNLLEYFPELQAFQFQQ